MLETSLHLTSEQLLILESFIQCTVETRTSASSVEVLEKLCCVYCACTDGEITWGKNECVDA